VTYVHPDEERVSLGFCGNCSCIPGDLVPLLFRPTSECEWPLCDCHTAYWASIPELEKRRLWGDR
jgi:hypothetical protein